VGYVGFIAWVLMGGAAAFLVGPFRGGSAPAMLAALAAGIAGALLGGGLLNTLLGVPLASFSLPGVLLAFVGAIGAAGVVGAIAHGGTRSRQRT
jgi:uncharacterized membrane protein YeaQ/YmgE (transglycosylase-associated protein family)